MKSAVKEKQQFVRLEVKKEDLLEMFKVSCLDMWLELPGICVCILCAV